MQTAVVAVSPGKLEVRQDIPIPEVEADTVLVKTAAVAINPHDAKASEYSAVPGAIIGDDFAGTVVALGPDAAGRFAIGDRVAGSALGFDEDHLDVGAFAQYVKATSDFLFRIPDDMSFEDASTLPSGCATVLYALFSELRIPFPMDRLGDSTAALPESEFVLVAGGSTATGTRAIQILKLAGFRPIATCSPSNFDLVRQFGAEKAFDYNQDSCADKIRNYSGGELAFALDCIAEVETTQLCYASIGRAGGRYVAVGPFREAVAKTRPTIEPSWFLVSSLKGTGVDMHGEFAREAKAEDRVFGNRAFITMQKLLDQGLVKSHPAKVMAGAWDGVVQGVAQVLTEPPSGYKLVYSV